MILGPDGKPVAVEPIADGPGREPEPSLIEMLRRPLPDAYEFTIDPVQYARLRDLMAEKLWELTEADLAVAFGRVK